MKEKRSRALVVLAVVLWAVPEGLLAHSDPWGEIHPSFHVHAGKLWVKFTEQVRADPKLPQEERFLQELNSPRWHAPVTESGYVKGRNEGWPDWLKEPERPRGNSVTADDVLFSAPWAHADGPRIGRLKDGEELPPIPLHYDGFDQWMTDGMMVEAREVVLLGTATFFKESVAPEDPFAANTSSVPINVQALWKVDRATGKTKAIFRVGEPERIYDFAVTSGLKQFGKFLYFAWVGSKVVRENEQEYEQPVMWLTRVHLETMRQERRYLGVTDWNTSIDVAVHKGKVWVAWHHQDPEEVARRGWEARARIKLSSVALSDQQRWHLVPREWPPALEWVVVEDSADPDPFGPDDPLLDLEEQPGAPDAGGETDSPR